MMNQMDQSVIQGSPSQGGSKGALVGTIIVILILIAGVIYFVTQQTTEPATPTPLPEEVVGTPDSANTSGTAPSTDELTNIEADVQATDFNGVNAELQGLEADLAQ